MDAGRMERSGLRSIAGPGGCWRRLERGGERFYLVRVETFALSAAGGYFRTGLEDRREPRVGAVFEWLLTWQVCKFNIKLTSN
jgi:hypothetical protein